MKDIVEIVQSIATIFAIIIGGIWTYKLFICKREQFPRAKISHNIIHKVINSAKLLLHVTVTISNTGNVLLSIRNHQIRAHQILPPPEALLDSIKSKLDPMEKNENEYQWPEIDSKESSWVEKQFEIEPGESDSIHYDFIINANLQTVQLYSYCKNEKKLDRDIGWSHTTFYDLRS